MIVKEIITSLRAEHSSVYTLYYNLAEAVVGVISN